MTKMALYERWEYLFLLCIFIISLTFFLSRTAANWFLKIIKNLSAEKEDQKIMEHLKEPFILMIITAGFFGLIKALSISFLFFDRMLISIFALLFFYILIVLIIIKFKSLKAGYAEIEALHKVEAAKNFRNFLLVLVFLSAGLLFVYIWNLKIRGFLLAILGLIVTNGYLRAISVFIIFLSLSKTILYLCKTYLANIIKRPEKQIEYKVLEKVEYPLSWIIIFVGANISLKQLWLGESILFPIVNTIIILFLMHTLNIIIENIINYWEIKWHRRTNAKIDDEIFLIAHNTSKVLIVILSALFILAVWGLASELKGLLLSLSVMGVIIGFAFKNTFSNIVGGISLMMDHAYKTNDVIKVESGEVGEVVKIGLRSTKIRTYDNEIITVPNSVLANSKITNYAQPNNVIRLTINVSVEYGSDPKKVTKVLHSCFKRKKFITNPEMTQVWFMEMSDYYLQFRAAFYINDYKERFAIKSKMTEEIYSALKKNKIKIPFPTRTLYVNEKKKNGKGSRQKNQSRKKAGKQKH